MRPRHLQTERLLPPYTLILERLDKLLSVSVLYISLRRRRLSVMRNGLFRTAKKPFLRCDIGYMAWRNMLFRATFRSWSAYGMRFMRCRMVFFRCTTYAVPVSGGVCPVVRVVECRLTACLFPVNLFDIKKRRHDVSVPVEACVRRWSGADGAHADMPFMARSMAVSAYIIRYLYDKKAGHRTVIVRCPTWCLRAVGCQYCFS